MGACCEVLGEGIIDVVKKKYSNNEKTDEFDFPLEIPLARRKTIVRRPKRKSASFSLPRVYE
jgi:hypothetical protein